MQDFCKNYLSSGKDGNLISIYLHPTDFQIDNVSILLDLKSRLKKNFFIMPYSLVSEDFLFNMIDFHHNHESLLTNMLINPTDKLKKGLSEYFTLYCMNSEKQLLYTNTFMKDDTSVYQTKLPKSLLKECNECEIHSKLINSKCYLLSKHIFPYLEAYFESELKKEIEEEDDDDDKEVSTQTSADKYKEIKSTFEYSFTDDFLPEFINSQFYNENIKSIDAKQIKNELFITDNIINPVRCYAFIQNVPEHFIHLIEDSKSVLRYSLIVMNLPKDGVFKSLYTFPSDEGSNNYSEFTDKDKKTLNTNKVKINNCIVGHDVTFGVNCVVNDSVIYSGCRIGNDVSIKNSTICMNSVVPDTTIIQNSVFTSLERDGL